MKRLYKYIDESIIGRKSIPYSKSKWEQMKTIPKRNELKHLDVLICANLEIFVCLDKHLCAQGLWSDVIQKVITHNPRRFEAYRLSSDRCIDSLGLSYFNSELRCPKNHPFDIQYVYEYTGAI